LFIEYPRKGFAGCPAFGAEQFRKMEDKRSI